MKSTASTLPADAEVLRDKSAFTVASELVKARLTLLVVLTTAVGFYAGSGTPVDFGLLLHATLGTALLAGGASVLNQLVERDFDALMHRTADRPLPSGRISPTAALLLGAAGSVAGLAWLLLAVNPLTAILGAVTLVSYVGLYTPLKRPDGPETRLSARFPGLCRP